MGKKIKKAVKAVTAPVQTVVKGAIQSTGDIASSALKGDIKGIASGALGAADTLKEAGKQVASGQLGFGTDALGTLGGLVGSRDISSLARNINREGQKGIEQYGDVAMDIGANVATGGTYGLAKTATQGLASQGLKGLLSGKGLQEAALGAAGSYAGIDPNMLKMGMSAAQGDLKGAALQGLGSYGGFDPEKLQMGMSALTGDKQGLASGLASQFGAGNTASSMIGQFAGGKGAREVFSDQAGAYADNEANRLLDEQMGRAGVSRSQLKNIERKVGQVRRAPAALKEEANRQYKISKGDSFNTIAKKLGVSPEELKAANPQLKDINKIAAGGTLNLPGASNAIRDLSGPLREGVVESGQMTEEQFNEARDQGPGFFDKAKDFIGRNKAGFGLGADALAAGAGFMAGEAGRKEAKSLSEQQLKELKGAGAAFERMQYDPERYKQEREFIQQRIAGGGVTPQEKKMQQEGDIRAARAAAAQRLSGMEQQARMGAGATGAGASLAASLAGGQAAMSEQSAANLAREASASQRLEQDIQRQTNLARQQTSEEADLAQQQGTFGLSRAQQTGSVRGDLGNLALGRAAALQQLAGQGAEMAKTGLSMMDAPKQEPQPQQSQQSPISEAKVGGARRLVQGRSPARAIQQPAPQQPMQQFNQQNAPQPGQGRGYGVLAPVNQAVQKGQQAVQRVQTTADQAKQKVEQLKKNPFGFKF